ncbi:protein of unknown function [Cupriavidus neocaledonicus]|uniref:Uncharacterized protein n=1 Tax=Cupriavidus neocaledonicus TaxID=1040979 RepID=A0A375HD73_9BURK|nr:hypothetical protein CBM2605_A260179 [Cupriavidus neocaledonicus]SPD48299.1 protein of unknown function [Cupriavidus neocaledonicus]
MCFLCWPILTKSGIGGNVPNWAKLVFEKALTNPLPKPHGRRVPFHACLCRALPPVVTANVALHAGIRGLTSCNSAIAAPPPLCARAGRCRKI